MKWNCTAFFGRILLASCMGAALPAVAQTSGGAVIQGLVFVSDPAQLDAGGRALSSLKRVAAGLPVDVSQAPLVQAPGFAEHLRERGLIGATLDETTLARLRAAVSDWLRDRGQGAAVIVPEQDATRGVVQVLVRQPRLGKLRIEGASTFAESDYRDAIRARPGEAINLQALDEDLAWIGRANPFRSAVAVASPGGQPGETDLTLRVTEERPWRLNLWAENTGTKSTQRERIGAGFTYGDAFDLGHVAGYHLSSSPDTHSYVGHTLTYSLPLPWRDTLSASANYARIHARVPSPLASDGTSSAFNIRYGKWLPDWRGLTQSASLALSWKASDNNVLFSDVPVFDNETAILQLEGGYEVGAADRWGSTSARLMLAISPGDSVSHNDDAAFDVSRAGAKARYQYLRLTLDRRTELPAAWQWSANVVGQWASENLLGSEQMGVMGMYGVRGFTEGGLYADQGVLWRNEIGPGDFALGGSSARARVFVTLDTAAVGNVERLPGEQRYRLTSAGLGMTVAFAGAYLWLEAATPVDDNLSNGNDTWRAHAGLRWAY